MTDRIFLSLQNASRQNASFDIVDGEAVFGHFLFRMNRHYILACPDLLPKTFQKPFMHELPLMARPGEYRPAAGSVPSTARRNLCRDEPLNRSWHRSRSGVQPIHQRQQGNENTQPTKIQPNLPWRHAATLPESCAWGTVDLSGQEAYWPAGLSVGYYLH